MEMSQKMQLDLKEMLAEYERTLIRQALGLQASPPNQVIVGMSLFLSFFVMGPTLDRIHEVAYQPFAEQQIELQQALEAGSAPLREFMLRQTPPHKVIHGSLGRHCRTHDPLASLVPPAARHSSLGGAVVVVGAAVVVVVGAGTGELTSMHSLKLASPRHA